MKHIYILFLLLFIYDVNSSQVTITKANLVGINDMIIQNHSYSPSMQIPTAGANQNWDYSSGLIAHKKDTMIFSSPGQLDNVDMFPSSKLAAKTGNGNELYYEKDAKSFRIIGVAADSYGAGYLHYFAQPAEELIRFPANYEDAYSTTSIVKAWFTGEDIGEPEIDLIATETHITKDIEIDAWGELSTPCGNYDVLRVSETKYITQYTTFFINDIGQSSVSYDTAYRYIFWSDKESAHFPVMQIIHDNIGNINSATWLDNVATVGMNSLEVSAFKCYPNPVSNILNMEFSDNHVAAVNTYSITGAFISSNQVANQKLTFDVSNLDTGLYFYNCVNKNGETLVTDKFIVSR